MRVLLSVLAILAGLAISGDRVHAHPTAASFVVITVPGDGRAHVAITSDGEGLRLRLRALSSGREEGTLADLATELPGYVRLVVNDVAVALSVDGLASHESRPDAVVVRLSAALPSDLRTITWASSLFNSAYPLSVGVTAPDALAADDYEWLEGTERSRVFVAPFGGPPPAGGFWRLVRIGFVHIVPDGLDHVLFVLGLFLLAANLRELALQITTFTLAHSVTLGLAYAGVLRAPAGFVEPLIALSIAWIAIENLLAAGLSRWRLAVVAAFGLLHGLGFAGALSELGLSGGSLLQTLAGFNLGVEIGQLAVVSAAAVAVAALRLDPRARRRWVTQPASIAIAAVGLYWVWVRISG